MGEGLNYYNMSSDLCNSDESGVLNRFTFLSYSNHFGSSLKNFFSYFYLVFSYIDATIEANGKSKVLMALGFDRVIRADHVNQFRKYRSILVNQGLEVDVIRYKRSIVLFSSNLFVNLRFLFKARFNLRKFLNCQFHHAINEIDIQKYQKVVVFADNAPFQNFICYKASRYNIETYSFQHGFYPPPNNRYWRRIYRCSTADKLFVWNEETEKHFLQIKKRKKFIKFAPLNFNKEYLKTQHFNDCEDIVDIAVYFCGKDQTRKNIYLSNVCKALEGTKRYKVYRYAHPGFSKIDFLVYKIKHKIKFEFVRKPCDLHIVLGSTIWLDFVINKNNFILLDSLYLKGESFSRLSDFDLLDRGVSPNVMPFLDHAELERTLAAELTC